MVQLRDMWRIILFLTILFAPLVLVEPSYAQEGEVTIHPIAYTYADSVSPDSNFGSLYSLQISKHDDGTVIYQKVVWLKFNLSSVSDGAVVDVATLELYCAMTLKTYNVYAHPCSNNSWTELGLTYSNMPLFNPVSTDSATVSTGSVWYNWNVLGTVQGAVDGIHGGPDIMTIVLQKTENRGKYSWVFFESKESPLYKPKLTVHWSGIIPEFPSVAILSLFMIITLLTTIVARKHNLYVDE